MLNLYLPLAALLVLGFKVTTQAPPKKFYKEWRRMRKRRTRNSP